MISLSGAYSRFVSPAPRLLWARNRFHSPSSFAFCFNCCTIGTGCQRSAAPASCSLYVVSFGYT